MRSKYAVRILALALLACALPSLALASSTRIQSLGLQGDYVLDNANVFTYPSAIVRYQNLVTADLGLKDDEDGNDDLSDFEDNNENPRLENADRSLGAILGNIAGGAAGTWGLFINENLVPMSPALGAEYFNRNANEALNLLWGYRLSSMAIGLEVNYSHSEFNEDPVVVGPYTSPPLVFFSGNNARQIFNEYAANFLTEDWNTFGIGGGLSFDFGADQSNMADVSVEYRNHSFEASDLTPGAAVVVEDDAGGSFAVNGRARFRAGNAWLVPVVNFYDMDFSLVGTDEANPANDFTLERSVTGFNAGLDTQWELRDGDWLHVGAAFQSVKFETEGIEEATYRTSPNIFVALESNLWSWLTLRLGASKPLFSELEVTDLATDESGSLEDSPLQYALGLGFHLGRIDLDALLNQDYPFTGSWFASGNSEIPVTRLSATYRW